MVIRLLRLLLLLLGHRLRRLLLYNDRRILMRVWMTFLRLLLRMLIDHLKRDEMIPMSISHDPNAGQNAPYDFPGTYPTQAEVLRHAGLIHRILPRLNKFQLTCIGL